MKLLIRSAGLIITFLFLLINLSFAGEEEWRGWRGLQKQACNDSDCGPVKWSASENILWKVHLEGEGYSSPVVSRDSVYITNAIFTRGKFSLNAMLLCIFTIIATFLIVRDSVLIVKNLNDNDFWPNGIISKHMNLLVDGLFLFCFCVICWMFFNENRSQSERILIGYFFSGSVVLLSLFFLIVRLPKYAPDRIISLFLLIISPIVLVKYHPIPEFYFARDFFRIENLWIFQLILPGAILPVLFSTYLLFDILLVKICLRTRLINHNLQKNSFLFGRIPAIFAFLFGLSGFISVPVISLVKWLNRDTLTRIQSPLGIKVFFDPDYSFPFFLSVITIGYVLLFLVSFEPVRPRAGKRHYIIPVMLSGCCLIFFIILNFLTNEPSYTREVICFDRYSGKIKWRKAFLSSPAASCSNYNSQATPTPVIDSNGVYAYFGSAGLIGADKTGRLKWKNTKLPFESIHGAGGSPVLCREGIVLSNSMAQKPYLTLIDSETGIPKWEYVCHPYSGVGGEYRTPLITYLNGKEVIVDWSCVRAKLVVYEPVTGAILYQYDTPWKKSGESISTPVINDGVIYLPNRSCMVALDLNKLSNDESPVLWISDLEEKGPDTSSPVFKNGMLFMISDNGIVTCLSARSGNKIWQSKLNGTFFSSPVAIGDRIYFSNSSGMTAVMAASSQFKVLAQNYLPEGIYATLAPVDEQLFIRTKNTLWCVK
jgi:outer membrane protein assembly factor BamB